MSLLSFLRVVEEIQQPRCKNHVPPRTRRLAVEALEGRAVLTLLGSLTPPIQIVTETIIAPVIESLPLDPSLPPEAAPQPEGGSGSGTGEPEPTDPLPDSGGSGSGSGEPGPFEDSPPTSGGSGSGSGSAAPVISSLSPHWNGLWVWFAGTVSDADGPVEGLTVYFTIGIETTVSFTASVSADGTFSSMMMVLAPDSLISAYTIDAGGSHSNVATCQT
jgi:hypothetical protein